METSQTRKQNRDSPFHAWHYVSADESVSRWGKESASNRSFNAFVRLQEKKKATRTLGRDDEQKKTIKKKRNANASSGNRNIGGGAYAKHQTRSTLLYISSYMISKRDQRHVRKRRKERKGKEGSEERRKRPKKKKSKKKGKQIERRKGKASAI